MTARTATKVSTDGHSQDQTALPQTPITPVSAGAVASLHDLIKQDADLLDDASKQRLQRRLQKLNKGNTNEASISHV